MYIVLPARPATLVVIIRHQLQIIITDTKPGTVTFFVAEMYF